MNLVESSESEYGVSQKLKPFLRTLNDPNKVKGELIITPATETQIAELNLQRYDKESPLLQEALVCAKKIDELKSLYHDKLRKELSAIILEASATDVSEEKKKELILRFQKSAKECELNLHEISYLHHLKIHKEYTYVLNRFRGVITNREEQKAFRFFGVHVAGLSGYLQKEKEFIFKQKLVENELLLAGKPIEEKRNQIQMFQVLQKEQVTSFNVDIIDYNLLIDNSRLKDDDVKSNPLVAKTFVDSIAKYELEKKYNISLKRAFAQIAVAYKNLSEKVDAKDAIVEAKKAVLDVAINKNEMQVQTDKKRSGLLKSYLKDSRDKEDQEHYKTKIKETDETIAEREALAEKLKAFVVDINSDTETLDAFLIKYDEALKLE